MRRPVFVLLAACCLLAAACTSTGTTGQGRPTGDRDRTQADGSTADPAPASDHASLDFTVDAVDGGTFRAADYAGDALAIWFWAPW